MDEARLGVGLRASGKLARTRTRSANLYLDELDNLEIAASRVIDPPSSAWPAKHEFLCVILRSFVRRTARTC